MLLVKKFSLERIVVRPVFFLVAACFAVITSATASAQRPPPPPTTILIGNVFALDPAVPVTTVRVSFEVKELNAPEDVFTLKIFDPGTNDPPESARLLAEKRIFVDGVDPVLPGEIWIDEPLRAMQWLEVDLDQGVLPVQFRLLIAIEIRPDQQGPESSLCPFVKMDASGDHYTFYSEDDGLTWLPLSGDSELCLGRVLCPKGSVDLKIDIEPC